MKPLKNSEGTSLFEPPQRVSNPPWGSILPIPGSLQIKNYHQSSKKNRYNASRKARGLWKLKTRPKRWFWISFYCEKIRVQHLFCCFSQQQRSHMSCAQNPWYRVRNEDFGLFYQYESPYFFVATKKKWGSNKHLRVVSNNAIWDQSSKWKTTGFVRL